MSECVTKDIWQNGHHTKLIVEAETGIIIADAYKSYHISHSEHEIRKNCRNDLLIAMSCYFGKVFTNTATSIKARFSKNTAGKIASDKAITKSVVNGFLPEEHFEAAENIKGIFEQADYIGKFPDESGDPNIIAIHRFVKAITLSNGRNCMAYITLKEVKKDGVRIYTQELLLNEYPPHEAGELTSRGFKRSGTTAYKCSPRTDLSITKKTGGVK